eukprot:gb/GECG01009564.1/.p1 GENE.gb/GECG01009564.1/~~gb/GECG01009564.1/.p1  ORF type:complete len:304 (+),score=34.01 gb/GECG01009564.1/:1-912(+)
MDRLYRGISPNMFVYGNQQVEQGDELVRLQEGAIALDRRAPGKRSLEPWDTLMEKGPIRPLGHASTNNERCTPEFPKHHAKHRKTAFTRPDKGEIEDETMSSPSSMNQRDRDTSNDTRTLEEKLEQTWPHAKRSKRHVLLHPPLPDDTETAFTPVNEDDTVLRAAVYHFQDAKKKQELLLLATQSLSVLPRIIRCSRNNEAGSGEGSCFYINGICYEDYNSAGCSQASGSCGMLSPERIGGKRKPMNAATFGDVQVSRGAHYIYRHSGDCQHVIVFTDLRPLTMMDEQNAAKYPLETYSVKRC